MCEKNYTLSWQHIFIEDMNRRYRQFAGVESAPGVPRMTVDDRLKIDSSHTLEDANKKGVHCHEVAGVSGFDMPLPVFRAEALQLPDLTVTEFKLLFSNRFFESQ